VKVAGNTLPDNDANGLYNNIKNNPAARNSTAVTSILTALGLQPVQDFEKPLRENFNQQIIILTHRSASFL
jgi:hypothetical protein